MSDEQLRPDPPPSGAEAPERSPHDSSVPRGQKGRRGSGSGLFVLLGGVLLTGLLAVAGGVLYKSKKHPLAVTGRAALAPKPTGLSIEAAPRSLMAPASSENFAYRAEGASDEYAYQLDGREKWRLLSDPAGVPLQVSDGDGVAFSASDAVCALSAPCTGPEGQGTAAGFSELDPFDFPAPDAHFQALIARVGESIFEVGRQKVYIVPPGTGKQAVKLMANIRIPELASTKYGYRVKIRILRAR